MPDFQYMNLQQKIDYYQGVTGITQRPEHMNDADYLNYLQEKSSQKQGPKKQASILGVVSKKKEVNDDE